MMFNALKNYDLNKKMSPLRMILLLDFWAYNIKSINYD